MKFEETKTIINKFLDGGQRVISPSQCIYLRGNINIICEDLNLLSKGEPFNKNSVIFEEILDSLLIVSDLVITSPLHDKFSEFLLAYSELIFNWNNNTYKDRTIFILSKFINNIVNSRDIMLKAILNMKETADKLEVMRSWSPGSFDISLAYVDEQLKINEKGMDG